MAEYEEIALSVADFRAVTAWTIASAERVLPLFEARAPDDTRPREAIEGAREFVREGKRTARMRALAWAGFAAAREVGDPAAAAAARAAQVAVAAPYLHPLATPHQSKHILGAAVYQVLARELAAGGDTGVAEVEIRWALDRVTATVVDVLRRFPPREPGRTRQERLYYRLDVALRG
ncbi:putative immunity protein [Nocardia pseudobrasiliensis]|uniref:Imm-5-like domain-containing protein n=1 Tax=Nocardia pseudobrasiliensis TaxID=45979 RepID=A0A370I3I0_9NOCA|nr:hypothetical protein [Nocardia pseudobrasiliensis]RDI63864.1 hypothetical protein DFR76_109204 [Nocardia pseudobrasiliensis]